jgi:pimeloyl-ACP methyl ester carboxylesterase
MDRPFDLALITKGFPMHTPTLPLALPYHRWGRTARVVLIAALIALAGLGSLLTTGQIARRMVAAGVPAPGRLIAVGDRRLHLNCQGPVVIGQPTIVLEAGLGESSLTWAGVQPRLAAAHRVCAYDRAGYGWSDAALQLPSAAAAVADLHLLLQAAGEPPPYVLVAHSLGGLYARLFAQRYPEAVAGLVLLDPSHEEMVSQLPEDWQTYVRSAQAEGVAALQVPTLLAELGIIALAPQLAQADARLPAAAQASVQALSGASARGWRALRNELAANEAILAEVRAARITDLGALPLVVVRAGKAAPTAQPPGLSAFAPTRDLMAELAAQSARGRLVTLGDSGHYVHYDAPVQVRDLVHALLDEIVAR